MIETEKKGSAWPWIVVPVAAVTVFFLLRECQHRLPPAEHVPATSVTVPAPETPSSPKPGEPAPAGEQPAVTPDAAPESEQAPAPQ
jgi:hypothetical protein